MQKQSFKPQSQSKKNEQNYVVLKPGQRSEGIFHDEDMLIFIVLNGGYP